jgi:branched-chain amino acid transport system permease protein
LLRELLALEVVERLDDSTRRKRQVGEAIGPAYTLLAFVIVITGGLGSMPGALLGGLLIGLTEALGGVLFTPSAKSMFAFGLLVLVLLFRPQGILGLKAGA